MSLVPRLFTENAFEQEKTDVHIKKHNAINQDLLQRSKMTDFRNNDTSKKIAPQASEKELWQVALGSASNG
jgi:hypothetical protein